MNKEEKKPGCFTIILILIVGFFIMNFIQALPEILLP